MAHQEADRVPMDLWVSVEVKGKLERVLAARILKRVNVGEIF